jgi:hypothetical protein
MTRGMPALGPRKAEEPRPIADKPWWDSWACLSPRQCRISFVPLMEVMGVSLSG